MPRLESSAEWLPASHPALGDAIRLHLGGDHEAALDLLQPAIAAGDSGAVSLAGQIRFELGRFEEAATAFRQLAERSPASLIASFNHGLALAKLRRWTPAIEWLQRAAVRDPERFEGWFALGVCLLGERRGDEADSCFHQVLKLRPEYVPALVGLAVALHLREDFTGALAIYRRLLEAQPEQPELLQNALAAASRLGDRKTAGELARRLLRLLPGHPGALAAAASAAIEQGDFAEASRLGSALAGITPASFENWLNLANCRLRAGEHDEAIRAFNHALELRPGDTGALEGRAHASFEMGRVHAQLGRWDQARSAFEQCLAQASNPSLKTAASDSLVLIAIEHGDIGWALQLCEELGVGDTAVLYKLAWICHEQERPDDARRLYCQVLEREPGNAEALLNLGYVLAWRGDRAESDELLKAAIGMEPALARSYFATRGESPVDAPRAGQ
jgi:tetratricopeptide (TPR) repeat protein